MSVPGASRGGAVVRCVGVLALVIASAGRISRAADDRTLLIEGVRRIGVPGAPGSIAVYAATASVIVTGKTDAGAEVAVVAAGHLGRGRLVAFGHDGYFSRETFETDDTGRLLVNAVRWASGGKGRPRVGLVDGRGLESSLKAKDIDARPARLDGDLSSFDVLVMTPFHVGPAEVERVRQFVRSGGGVLAAATGWGWQQLNGGRPMPELPGNKVFAGSGLAWTDGLAPPTSKGAYAVGPEVSPLVNAATAVRLLEHPEDFGAPGIATATESIRLALSSLPADDRTFRADVAKLVAKMPRSNLVPSRKRPIRTGDTGRRLAVMLEAMIAAETPAREVRAAAAAREFPGPVPAGAARVKRTVTIDTAVHGWHGLGLYAAPGEAIEIRAETPVPGLTAQIGCHTDELWHLKSWERSPQVVRRFPLVRGSQTIASAFGGLIYIDVPARTPSAKVEVVVDHAIEAPSFELGVTSREEWAKSIRSRPAPWAELAGRNVIFTVPSRSIRSLDDPGALLTLWDRMVAAQDAFVSRPKRDRPERIVTDVQISAGYMHSGYPIMVPDDDSLVTALSLAKLRREGTWGHLHELGHNHQEPDWTFSGTGEVTNNVMVLYVYDRILGLPYDSGHPEIRDRRRRAERIQAHIAAGAPFAKWKDDPFLALMMYMQLYEGFGWEPFEKVFAEYRTLRRGDRPRSDEAKRDQWLIRFSKAAGRNLGPFFRKWGVPTSDRARAEVAGLPDWMPPGFE